MYFNLGHVKSNKDINFILLFVKNNTMMAKLLRSFGVITIFPSLMCTGCAGISPWIKESLTINIIQNTFNHMEEHIKMAIWVVAELLDMARWGWVIVRNSY
jgi:hypothetical protein